MNISSIFNKSKRLKILTFPTHERYQSLFTGIDADFYLWRGGGDPRKREPRVKDWNEKFGGLPNNHTLLSYNKDINDLVSQIPRTFSFDLILIQTLSGQYQIGTSLAQYYQIPFIRLEHTQVMPNWTNEFIANVNQSDRSYKTIFITEYNKNSWQSKNGEVIYHTVNPLFFDTNTVRENKILSVANEFPQRGPILGFDLWKHLVQDLPYTIVGDSPGLSEPARSVRHLSHIYNTHSIFLNTSQVSPLPMSLLEAMACGCGIVTTATCDIPNIIKHNENGLISNNPDELRKMLQYLLDNPEEARRLGQNAIQTIKDKFDYNTFIEKWTNVFQEVSNMPFRGIV